MFMKFWKSILLGFFAFFAISATVLISSCEKDACTELKCKNGSACTEGFCRCQTGFEGSECEMKTVNRFIGTYIGYNHCDKLPALLDTVDVYQYPGAGVNAVEFHLRRNYPGDKFRGTVDGYTISVADEVNGGSNRKVNAKVDHDQLTVFVERNFNTAEQPGFKSVCTFVGTKQ